MSARDCNRFIPPSWCRRAYRHSILPGNAGGEPHKLVERHLSPDHIVGLSYAQKQLREGRRGTPDEDGWLLAEADGFELRQLLFTPNVNEWMLHLVPVHGLLPVCCGRAISFTDSVELPAFG